MTINPAHKNWLDAEIKEVTDSAFDLADAESYVDDIITDFKIDYNVQLTNENIEGYKNYVKETIKKFYSKP